MKKIISLSIAFMLIVACFSLCVSADSLTNIAEKKAYTVNLGENTAFRLVADGYSDGDEAPVNQKMTDGIRATDGGTDPIGALKKADGTNDVAPNGDYIIDLGKSYDNIVKFSFDQWYGSWGISEPASVEYFISADGTNYTSVGKVETADAEVISEGTWSGVDYVVELDEAVSARYIKVSAVGGNYVWGSEIQVFAKSTGTTTPDTGDTGITVFAIITLVSFAGAYIVKKVK
ncbi:discoidin domain-containing protein [Eubacteriales bacterium OttesenSCG-928-G02]|nr:discoidin domain-containing protein [Eubacteriales bacterium OttesenSCG-928-G02]